MFKFFTGFGSFLIIVNYVILANTLAYKCIHDDISLKKSSISNFSRREKRNIVFEPLHIHVHKQDIDSKFSKYILSNIDFALQRAINFISETIQVRQSMNPFFLERESCSQKWRSGLNKGKCSRKKSGPEFCSTRETDFIIPNRYLSKLEVFDNKELNPILMIEKGSGVQDSNFILFVISKSTSWCSKSGIQAYGSYCKLDKTNRPIAGLLNLCPDAFSKSFFESDHYFNVIIHELFHILGFSKHLFPKFKTCTSNDNCEIPKKIVSKSNGVVRLIFPEVVQSMQSHFGCSKEEFGAPLENFTDTNVENGNEYTSHWHPLLMYSSIMTPAFTPEDYVSIDNISLALLASTGWYKIDFSKAQAFNFGEDEGCNFGFGDDCRKSKYLCEFSNETGCDVSRQTIGKCEKVDPYYPCGVFKPNKDKSCIKKDEESHNLDHQFLEFEKKCIMLQRENDSLLVPTCMVLTCGTSASLNLLAGDTWVECENENLVLINNISVKCPSENSYCLTKKQNVVETFRTLDNNKFAISVQMIFKSPSANDISNSENFRKFKADIVQAIASYIDVPINYIVNSSLTVRQSVYLSFVICPPNDINNTQIDILVKNTQDFLDHSTFTGIFRGKKDLPVASTEIFIDPELVIAFSDQEGFRMLVIVPVVCGIFVIATFIASLMRLVTIRRHRPQRKNVETQELSDVSVKS